MLNIRKVINALRCISLPGEESEPYRECDDCPYSSHATMEIDGRSIVLDRCDLDRIGLDAADLLDRYRWHDLRKNPDDLPRINNKIGTSKQVMFIDMDKEPYIGCFASAIGVSGHIRKRWYADFCDDKIKDVIAWREIGPFEEESEE